ncbi:hypothetical protein ACWFNS_16945 [Oerskovia enterophila]|uniref:Uncharacterized protein n=1 Tax=Oerskovia enterophila TaxID=43678 RepID=A0A163QNI0_9CELL|nr:MULTISPECIES: hypothetical protein [Oerskovia]KRC32280.1 hypothetical protein ASE15_16540 [Oerskovia sp. Root22]KRD40640.1 hypothetical protein ASE27_19440 [Oerskovia sp. Root918]KZM34361.1 hypothetical protein OJAG_29250 [Oerskovia enterophila]OCI29672.1 hypothetical protein OERS_36400 [Oerskovia enterophila]
MSSQTTQRNEATERAGAVARFLVAFILFVGGMVAFGWAFTVESGHAWIFSAGLALVTLGCFIPMAGRDR